MFTNSKRVISRIYDAIFTHALHLAQQPLELEKLYIYTNIYIYIHTHIHTYTTLYSQSYI